MLEPSSDRLRVQVGPLTLKNPVMPAAGCFNYGREFAGTFDLGQLGAVVNKTVMPRPQPGNAPPRVVETPSGLLNAIGLPSEGPDAFVRDQLPFMRSIGTTVIVSIGGYSPSEFGELAERLAGEDGIAALELDLSCPNLRGGTMFASSARAVRRVLAEVVERARGLPVFVKLSPAVTEIVPIARAARGAGAAGAVVANTYPAMVINPATGRPALGNVQGGLSGPAIRPITLRLVWQIFQELPDFPVIAAGGITNADDAVQYLLAGARAVQLGTVLFSRPLAPLEVLAGLEAYLKEHGLRRVTDLVGAAHRGGIPVARRREGSDGEEVSPERRKRASPGEKPSCE